MKRELITKTDPKSPVSEVFRALRTNIQYMAKSSKTQTMVFTSTTQGEGKSWVVANLAIAFAQANKNVVIIDADMRRPRQNSIFGVDMFPGLSNFLSGVSSKGTEKDITVKDCIQATEVDNLYIIPAGNIPPNPSELLASQKAQDLIEELKTIFDVIIFDGAPCLLVTDATVISRIVDSTIIVASYNSTKIEDLKEAKARIENIGGHVAGVVLNRVKVSGKKYENRYYYSSSSTKNYSNAKRLKEKEDDDKKINEEDIIEQIKKISKKTNKSQQHKKTKKSEKSKKSEESDDKDKVDETKDSEESEE